MASSPVLTSVIVSSGPIYDPGELISDYTGQITLVGNNFDGHTADATITGPGLSKPLTVGAIGSF